MCNGRTPLTDGSWLGAGVTQLDCMRIGYLAVENDPCAPDRPPGSQAIVVRKVNMKYGMAISSLLYGLQPIEFAVGNTVQQWDYWAVSQ